MKTVLDVIHDQELMIQALRGHLTGLDHAVHLLLADARDVEIIRSAWNDISHDLQAKLPVHSDPGETMYAEALKQCMTRISDQLRTSSTSHSD